MRFSIVIVSTTLVITGCKSENAVTKSNGTNSSLTTEQSMQLASTTNADSNTASQKPKNVISLLKRYHLREPISNFFNEYGGGFEKSEGSVCNNYPNCPTFFKKVSRESGCLIRGFVVGSSYQENMVETVTEQWVGKCNAQGDHPKVKDIIKNDDTKPNWIKDSTERGYVRYVGTWMLDDGYMMITAYCRDTQVGRKITNFGNCHVETVGVNLTKGAVESVTEKYKKNDMPF